MENNYLNKIFTLFRDVTLSSSGTLREAYEYIEKKDIYSMLNLMVNNDREVNNALREYNTQTHKVMFRPNKKRKGKPPYITEKLPRNKQQYINEVELFFLLGKAIEWKLVSGDSEAFAIYCQTWKNFRLDSVLRKAKRLAGAETESAIVFNIAKAEDGKLNITPYVAARSTGYRLRPLFDQYGRMLAYAHTYRLRERGRNVLHCDFMSDKFIFLCKLGEDGWKTELYDNPIKKIPVLYFWQQKAWDGAVPRIEREEHLDSKVGDTNNYFADPKAMATADVVSSIADPDIAGNLVQLTGSASRFEYINPPQNSVTRQDEKADLQRSIFFDTFTPDLSYDSIKGLGTLSGAAMHNALILGYIKRDVRKEVYEPMVDRLRSVLYEIIKITDARISSKMDSLQLSFSFPDPFATRMDNWAGIRDLYTAGLMSLETAINQLGIAENSEEEIKRIKAMMNNNIKQ